MVIESQALSRSFYLAPRPSPSLFNKLDQRHIGRLRKRDKLLTGEGEGGGRGAKSHDCKRAWSSLNHSILSIVLHNTLTLSLLQLFRLETQRQRNSIKTYKRFLIMHCQPGIKLAKTRNHN